MKQEDKELLLKDLCARLPYDVMVNVDDYDTEKLIGIENETITTKATPTSYSDKGEYPIDIVKPYLRPMSSMTEEEKREYKHLIAFSGNPIGSANLIDWLNKKMFAYHTIDDKDMFELGLAIEVTEYNNPYK